MRESSVEGVLVDLVSKKGGWCCKLQSPHTSGIPDRLVLFRGRVYFVELKAPGKQLRPLQVHVHSLMRKHGAQVFTIDTVAKVQAFVATL